MDVMIILPGLTSTKKERIPDFIRDLRKSETRHIALFPTCLNADERWSLYRELEEIPGLGIPHVHLRADCGLDEFDYLAGRFGTMAFNIHPRASSHPFGPLPAEYASRIFIENVEQPPEDEELAAGNGQAPGGLCPDFSHFENARLHGLTAYVETFERQLDRFAVGCCHMSAIRVGVPNHWAGMWDHHEYAVLDDLSYLAGYRDRLPREWASLELENSFGEQLAAKEYLEDLFRL